MSTDGRFIYKIGSVYKWTNSIRPVEYVVFKVLKERTIRSLKIEEIFEYRMFNATYNLLKPDNLNEKIYICQVLEINEQYGNTKKNDIVGLGSHVTYNFDSGVKLFNEYLIRKEVEDFIK